MEAYKTETGLILEGPFENYRNTRCADLFKEVIREVFGPRDVIVAHHIVYVTEEKRPDGFTYQIVEEIPSADALLFDHDIARVIWGPAYLDRLGQLAAEPCATRDALFERLYRARTLETAQ